MKKILFIVLVFCSWLSLKAQNEATEVITQKGVTLYRYDKIYYKITDNDNKEVMTVDPTNYGLLAPETWFYCYVEVNLPEKISIEGEDYTVTAIDSSCFKVLTEPCTISSTVKVIGHSNDMSWVPTIEFGLGVEAIESSCLSRCYFETLNLPLNIISLGEYCVNDNDFLKTVDIPDGLTSIGAKSFSNNKQLESIILPGSLQYVGYDSFNNNPSLKSVTLDAEIKDFEWGFNKCPAIERIEFTGHPSSSYPELFFRSSFLDIDTNKCVLIVPDGTKNYYKNIFSQYDYPLAKLQILEKSEEVASAGAVISDQSRVEVSRYTTDGVQVDENYKGIVIIQYSDGTTAKRFVE